MTEEDNKYLAGKMGFHRFIAELDSDGWVTGDCSVCYEPWLIGKHIYPDFSSEHGFFLAWNWAKEQEWWDTFITQEEKDIGVSSIAFEVDWVGDKEEYINTK